VSSSRPRGSSGCTACARLERIGLERRQQRRHGRALPQARGFARHHFAGLALDARRRLDLDVQQVAVGQAEARHVLQRGQRLARVAARMPAAGVELRQLAPRLVAAEPRPLVVRSSVASCIRNGTPSADSFTSHSNMR
jgi:hypothetical protein